MPFDFDYRVDDAGVATITFNRPDVLNAITLGIYAQLRDLMEALRYDDAVKAIVLTGEGRAFCSGGDVHEIIGQLLDADVKDHLDFTRMTGITVRNMRLLDKPIVAAVNGVAAGAGAVLALASDLRIASDKASFAFLFTKVGLTGADMGAAYLLPKIVGLGRANEILMFGDKVDAATAERWGLVNRVVPPDDVLPTAQAWARRLAEGPTQAIRMTKRRIQTELHMDLIAAIESEAEAQALLMMAEDHRVFHAAFTGKTEPRWVGR
ncbi:enoyl-CoA hydratase family protein [bacterium]|nr:enoyl-CoA hydratase family protein [Chloroflexi bacterium CFX6]RIL11198.1 MAG: enoyl-CoA hydratase family protein [bacterium]